MEYLKKSDVMAVVNRIVAQDIDKLPTITLDDAISRKDLLDSVGLRVVSDYYKCVFAKIINSMPSIHPSPASPEPDKLLEMILNAQSFCPDINPAVFDLFRELATRLSKVEGV